MVLSSELTRTSYYLQRMGDLQSQEGLVPTVKVDSSLDQSDINGDRKKRIRLRDLREKVEILGVQMYGEGWRAKRFQDDAQVSGSKHRCDGDLVTDTWNCGGVDQEFIFGYDESFSLFISFAWILVRFF